MATVYVEKEKCDHIMIANDTGADLAQKEFAVVGPFAAVADTIVLEDAVGSFHVEEGIQIQTDNLEDGEDTFATIGQTVYFNTTTGKFSDTSTAGYYIVGYLVTVKDSAGVILFEKTRYAILMPASLVDIQAEVDAVEVDVLALQTATDTTLPAAIAATANLAGKPFRKVATLTSALATTPVDILTDAEVGAGKKAYITSFLAVVNGAVAWEGDGTIVTVQDTNGTAVVGITMAKAQLTSAALLDLLATGVTLGDAVALGTGFTAAKGLVIVADDAFGTGGSDIVVTVCGFIA